MSASVSRLPLVDALKAVAAQLIILHHLAFYGPMADAAMELAPALFSWLAQQARIAVQVFLVIGGFLAARKLAPRGELLPASPLAVAWRRYLKLAVPYVAALVLSIICAMLARLWMSDDSIPAAPMFLQFIAHALLLQDILGFEALSAGVWYVAIDFQLFILLLSGLWMARRLGAGCKGKISFGLLLVAGLGIASLFHFNRNAAWGSLGAVFLCFLRAGRAGVLGFGTRPLAGLAWIDGSCGCPGTPGRLPFAHRSGAHCRPDACMGAPHRPAGKLAEAAASGLPGLGRISYSVFLVHFPVCLVVNALFNRLAPGNPALGAIGMLLAWAASNAAGALFFRCVEAPVVAWNRKPTDPMLK